MPNDGKIGRTVDFTLLYVHDVNYRFHYCSSEIWHFQQYCI